MRKEEKKERNKGEGRRNKGVMKKRQTKNNNKMRERKITKSESVK